MKLAKFNIEKTELSSKYNDILTGKVSLYKELDFTLNGIPIFYFRVEHNNQWYDIFAFIVPAHVPTIKIIKVREHIALHQFKIKMLLEQKLNRKYVFSGNFLVHRSGENEGKRAYVKKNDKLLYYIFNPLSLHWEVEDNTEITE